MNNYRKVVLDSSAFIALLDQENGWEKVSEVINKSLMSSVNVSEVTKFLIDLRSYNRSEAREITEQLLGGIIDFSAEHAYIAAELYPDTKALGLSLGDRACLALALVSGYPIYTADRVWGKLNIPEITIKLVR